ncbi:MAG: metallophosphoesterase [Proteobacteria bacterium]|nr:metallophosphoesterase [Pseudomonadota bacterium]
MFFIVALLIISVACSTITIRTLVSYSDMKRLGKMMMSGIIIVGWFSPIFVRMFKNAGFMSSGAYDILYTASYTLYGFVFILFCFLILRDILWYAVYGLARLLGYNKWSLNPKNLSVLSYANYAVLIVSALVSGWALYEGIKVPQVKELTFHSGKLSRDMRIVHLTDLHINRTTPLSRINKIVNTVNNLGADVIVMTGDIIDDDATRMEEQLAALQGLSAPYGIYVSLGNHEYYSGLSSVSYRFRKMGFPLLMNRGTRINNSGLFIAGIPDAYTAATHPTFNINIPQALQKSHDNDYKILLSHTPEVALNLDKSHFDLILAGHTHGGQIFPFHYFVKKANKFLTGEYDVNGIKLYVSNGAGTWGPMMRLFAPSDITVINLFKK